KSAAQALPIGDKVNLQERLLRDDAEARPDWKRFLEVLAVDFVVWGKVLDAAQQACHLHDVRERETFLREQRTEVFEHLAHTGLGIRRIQDLSVAPREEIIPGYRRLGYRHVPLVLGVKEFDITHPDLL